MEKCRNKIERILSDHYDGDVALEPDDCFYLKLAWDVVKRGISLSVRDIKKVRELSLRYSG